MKALANLKNSVIDKYINIINLIPNNLCHYKAFCNTENKNIFFVIIPTF